MYTEEIKDTYIGKHSNKKTIKKDKVPLVVYEIWTTG